MRNLEEAPSFHCSPVIDPDDDERVHRVLLGLGSTDVYIYKGALLPVTINCDTWRCQRACCFYSMPWPSPCSGALTTGCSLEVVALPAFIEEAVFQEAPGRLSFFFLLLAPRMRSSCEEGPAEKQQADDHFGSESLWITAGGAAREEEGEEKKEEKKAPIHACTC